MNYNIFDSSKELLDIQHFNSYNNIIRFKNLEISYRYNTDMLPRAVPMLLHHCLAVTEAKLVRRKSNIEDHHQLQR